MYENSDSLDSLIIFEYTFSQFEANFFKFDKTKYSKLSLFFSFSLSLRISQSH
jgi:hypothetical protein